MQSELTCSESVSCAKIPTGCDTLSFAGNRTISEMALSRRSIQAETTEFAKADLLWRRGGITTALLQDLFVLAVDARMALRFAQMSELQNPKCAVAAMLLFALPATSKPA